jgi:anti-anti-sigma regulatory factor
MKNELTYSITSKKDSSLKIQNLTIEGDLGANNAEAIRAKLLSTDFKYDVNIELTKIETLDLACIQLIYSLVKTLVAKGLKVNIKSDFSDRLEEAVRNTGFIDLIKA